jgi:peptide/nickel transport system substrate-binding protein
MSRFRTRIVGGLAIAVASATALAACSSSSHTGATGNSNSGSNITVAGSIGSVPQAKSGTETPGTITWGMAPGTPPNFIFPVVTGANNSVFNVQSFQWEFWRPLYWTSDGTSPQLVPDMSLANVPTYTNGDQTVTISLKSTFKWSDGQPITADDILFYINMVQAAIKEAPSNWEAYVPGHFPDTLKSTSEPNSSTLVLNLSAPVNPSWFTLDVLGYGPVVPMPSHAWAKESATGAVVTNWQNNPAVDKKIYDYLMTQNKALSTYATNPLWQVVDGPYKISAYNTTSGGYTMVPNTTYGGPHAAKESTIEAVPFTSDTAEFNAIKDGQVDFGYVPQTDVPQLKQLAGLGYDYFGIPVFGDTDANFNFKDTTGDFNNIVAQLYFRQAMAHLEDQQGWIKAFMYGAGGAAYGPIPAYPQSPFLPADAATDPYPYSISTAVSLLKSHGWTINAGGTDVCSSAGSGASQCGAGIPAGTKLSFNFLYSTAPAIIGEQAQDLASAAKQAGINITLQSSNFNTLIDNYTDPGAPANESKWAINDFGGNTMNPYPTTFGLFNTGGSGQVGDYSNPTADSLINASISGGDPNAVKTEASYLTSNIPVLFQPNPDYIWAWKNTISGNPDSFENLTQYNLTPEFWYFTK